MIPSPVMPAQILLIMGPTASGKSSRAVEEARRRDGEVISVDSRQIYRGLDIGTEKITTAQMQGVPHHLIDIRSPNEPYSAGDFVQDASRLIREICLRGKLPILAGGTHFYFDALLGGLPAGIDANPMLRAQLENYTTQELFEKVRDADPRRARELDPQNRRRLIRALEIIETIGHVPLRYPQLVPIGTSCGYLPEWIVIDPQQEELRTRIDARLENAMTRGLMEEVQRVRAEVGDERLNELGLEYRVIGEFLRGERTRDSILPALSAKLWQYARRQKAWLRKLHDEQTISEAPLHRDRN